MMRAGDDVGDDLRVLGIGDAWLQNADDGGRARIDERSQAESLAEHRGIAVQGCRPETIRQYSDAGSLRAIIVRIQQAAEYGAQSHHLEVRASDHAGANRARFAESDHRETYD